MCGIWGFLTLNSSFTSDTNLHKNFMKIKHRGPDRSTFITNNNYQIGFHRLAIMDTSIQGDQPFSHSYKFIDEQTKREVTRTLYVICNGEIYNYKEIKESEEFKSKVNNFGYSMRSNSDCEIILPLFLNYGIDYLNKNINGEYAFAIYDIYEDPVINKTFYSLYLSRDKFGIRPLFFTTIDQNTFAFCSEMKGLQGIKGTNKVEVFKPRTWLCVSGIKDDEKLHFKAGVYYKIGLLPVVKKPDLDEIYGAIRRVFTKAVERRLDSDREIGCLLSGGLDSSLVAAIASQYLKSKGKTLKTFSIGMKDSTDSKYAEIVSKHIGSTHTNIEIPESEWLDKLEKIIEVTETFDITTIRASTGQYLVSKWIRDNTDIKVLLIGDGSDELTGGYLYFHNAPDPDTSHFENVRLLEDIHFFDVLRADRGIASNGLEARVPFLDQDFVNMYLSIDPVLRVPTLHTYPDGKKAKCEKWLLRQSFDSTDLLPKCVLWRKKEAFSDGVSSQTKSWYQIIQEKINSVMSTSYLMENANKYKGSVIPHTKEAMYYHEIFDDFFPKQYGILPYYWLPKWVDNPSDPSARTLNIYTDLDKTSE
jgi:asparagine synthase (glutamine-hydrolysing)